MDLIHQAYMWLDFSHTTTPILFCHNFVCATSEKATATADHLEIKLLHNLKMLCLFKYPLSLKFTFIVKFIYS